MANRTVTTWLTGDLINATKLNNVETGISQSLNWNATTGGSATVYTLDLTPAPSAYYEGMEITAVPHADNTGAFTINVNSLGAIAVKIKGVDPSAGMFKAGCPSKLIYHGTSFFLGSSASGDATAADLLAGKTATIGTGEVITGTMTDRAGDTAALSSSVSGTTLKLKASDGYRDGVNDNVTITDADFVAANIVRAKDIFGVTGIYMTVTGNAAIVLQTWSFTFGTATTLTLRKTITVKFSGTIRFTGDALAYRQVTIDNNGVNAFDQTNSTASSVTMTADIPVVAGDVITFYERRTSGSGSGSANWTMCTGTTYVYS